MLIRRAEMEDGSVADIRLEGERIAAIGDLAAARNETVLDAMGGLLLPGLHDHHIHVAATAAAIASVRCGPPEVTDARSFAAALRVPGDGWLRGTGYHESVAGMPDAAMLDRIVPDRPVRIQHRSGRMWFVNSAGLAALCAGREAPPGLDRATGRLFDADAWLRESLGGTLPSFAAVGAMLARVGVTGLTEMSPANDARVARHFAVEHASGALPQRILLAGNFALSAEDMAPGLVLGAAKLHLHEADLPSLADAIAFTQAAHSHGRAVAVHCATEVELIFTLAMFADAGVAPGDRIEHASVAPDFAIDEIARLGLAVVSQPHFIAERGDAYLRDVEPEQVPLLYRLRAFIAAGVPLAAGSDAPFGGTDPWIAMAAAVSRRTRDGAPIGADESLTPEQALDLYLRDPQALDRRRKVIVGAPADLCLLDRPWARARDALSSALVRATIIGGRLVHDRVDQPPA
jgi:predicted amidohydrolase YtcJ